MPMKKKGQMGLNDIAPTALAVTIGVIVVAIIALVLSGFYTNATTLTTAQAGNNTSYILLKGMQANTTFADWFNIIVVIVVSVIVISLVLMLRFRQGGSA